MEVAGDNSDLGGIRQKLSYLAVEAAMVGGNGDLVSIGYCSELGWSGGDNGNELGRSGGEGKKCPQLRSLSKAYTHTQRAHEEEEKEDGSRLQGFSLLVVDGDIHRGPLQPPNTATDKGRGQNITQINIYGKTILLLLAGNTKDRTLRQLKNQRGHTLQCSHYVPSTFPDDTSLPCVIYCHGNSGCRADANEAAVILLPSNITVFTLDFSGSGLSEGDYVSLGWHEKEDLKVVVSYLRKKPQISCIGLWGRSMGAVTSLLYGGEDPSIAGMVLDSAFSNLFDLMMELVDVYKIRLPKFTVKVAVQYMRRVIQKKAKFDIMDLNCLQVAPKTFIPALFGHANDDKFVQSRHSDLIFKSYAGDKNIIKFDGDHNSSRPQFYYESVSIFFYNILRPPQLSSSYSSNTEKYHDLGDLKVDAGVDENLLYEIIAGLQTVGTDAASSSSVPRCISTTKSVNELLLMLLQLQVIQLSMKLLT
ncbi:uncharacterized protein LOC127808674 [Diospyros lotus]|uniref:uncharacterized protein LOC127808674 n=1 Tax=Diospyros lotus TaxID=55363 RepID=UPI00225B8254|nr:uncharacterized protein LOC127808674 [Diospyros lotus]